MNTEERVRNIMKIFDDVYNDAACTLDYETALQLLIATQLAAQCTDVRVNLITKKLFKKYNNVFAFANAAQSELERDIRSAGFFRNKAKNIIACCNEIINNFNGHVPDNLDALLTLSGVGRKTANVVLGEIFGVPGIVVDTHAIRLTNRLGLTESKDPLIIENDLMKIIPRERWNKFCHQLVRHGREICVARKPRCDVCPVPLCAYSSTLLKKVK